MTDHPRLIEVAFPLRQASLDSVHEKNVRHGHISTLHIWPARRPLAACRAALIATLLPDPGTDEGRQELLEKIGGHVLRKVEKDKVKEETEGGVLHWGRENSEDMNWFREQIRKAYGGRAPRVLDPFSGGGAIPLEAMRLGCEVTAVDINPVAWFILKCTLEYPQKLAGQLRPLPKFAVDSAEFMEGFLKGTGVKGKRLLDQSLRSVQQGLFPPPDVDLAWHVRAWGWWVLQKARADLQKFYPVVDGKPTVAYLWARTVTCKNCRATVPLLKTRWLCKKDNKRVVLTMQSNADETGVILGVQNDVPVVGGSAAQRREHDKKVGGGTMSRSGAMCPCCGTITTIEDIRLEGRAGRLGCVMTAVVVDGKEGKEYRLPEEIERQRAEEAAHELDRVFADVPFGLPDEPTPAGGGSGAGRAFSVQGYGLMKWRDLFTPRQLLALGTFVRHTHAARQNMQSEGYPPDWIEAISAYLALSVDRLADRGSTLCRLDPSPTQSGVIPTFARFALPMTWDFIEAAPLSTASGGFSGSMEWIPKYLEAVHFPVETPPPVVLNRSAKQMDVPGIDVIVTDPPYYDAIPYSDLMDFFYHWLRRNLAGLSSSLDSVLRDAFSPKWDHAANDGELIDDSSRHQGDNARSKSVYEEGMADVFQQCLRALNPTGRLVIVFAHKHPNAWETLVSALIRSGFVVDGSWPVQTERLGRMRAFASAALASSVWLVCKKRPAAARPGWDNRVLEDMRANIHQRLNDYWKAGIRGPDFVWAATGPALEAYSKHPVVKKATEPGQVMTVSEFLRAVRRIVVDFVVGRVLTKNGDGASIEGLDDLTTYYLLHRHDFGLEEAPIGACILYAISCNLSDATLVDRHDLLLRTGGKTAADTEDEEEAGDAEDDEPEESGSGSKVKLKPWSQRKRKTLGYDVDGKPPALIDQVHRLMHLWKAGDVVKVDEYIDERGLRRYALFHQLLQALIELAPGGTDERALLESISNHVVGRGVDKPAPRTLFDEGLFTEDA